MALVLADDDSRLGAPNAVCSPNDVMWMFAPASCTAVVGAVPPLLAFHRHDFFWLSLSLSACSSSDAPPLSLDDVYFGIHTLKWTAMRETVAAALAAGFNVAAPSDIVAAVREALLWSAGNRSSLRMLTAQDFEPLPVMPPSAHARWWLATSFSSWVEDGVVHPLCHALGYTGRFWETATREADSRFYLSLMLTQEFIPVSATVPAMLYGDPAIRFYYDARPSAAISEKYDQTTKCTHHPMGLP